MSSRRLVAASVLYHLLLGTSYANVSSSGPGYTAGFLSNTIYSINLQTGATFPVTTIGGSGPDDLALLNKNTAYVLGNSDGNIYSVNLQNNTYSRITPTPIPPGEDPFAIAVANSSTAYVVTYASNTIYSINLQTGGFSPLTTISAGNPGLYDIAIASNTTAYVIGDNNNLIYQVNLQTGASSVVATIPGAVLGGITLVNSTTACVVGNGDNTVRLVDLQTGASSIVTTIAGAALEGVAVSNTTAYTVGDTSNAVYAVNLLNNNVSTLVTLSGNPELSGMALLLQMPTNGLHGNNVSFANYLNANGPIDVIREFALLPSGLEQALESAAPTRNAFLTYASQNAFLAASQALADHGRQKRFHFSKQKGKKIAAANLPMHELLASNAMTVNMPCKSQEPYTIWLSPFGEYAREKPQQQTPGFSLGLGGAVLGFELSRCGKDVAGFGAAYAYTHVHEEAGAGQANLNQGFLIVYGTLNAAQCYFDLGLWGGYYHSNNQRKISFSGVDATAQSETHGWQAAPHFEVGYDGFWIEGCSPKWFGIEPFLMADWVANWESGFQEHGAGSLDMGQKGRFCSLLRGESGLRFHEIVEFGWGRLVIREKGSYAYQKAFHTGRLTAFLAGSPGTFTVETLTTAQNLGIGEFAILFAPANGPYIDLRYQGEFGSQYQSHQGMLEIGKTF